MRISVSLPAADVQFLDEVVATEDVVSRSALVHSAIELLRQRRAMDDYAAAFDEWAGNDSDDWDVVIADGIISDS